LPRARRSWPCRRSSRTQTPTLPLACATVADLWTEWRSLDLQIEASNQEIEQIATSDPACTRLRSIPGIGPLIATPSWRLSKTVLSSARDGNSQPSWGWCPRQYSTGGKAHLLGSSKRGNSYLRKLSSIERVRQGQSISEIPLRAGKVRFRNSVAPLEFANSIPTGPRNRASVCARSTPKPRR
jgi:transposase